MLLHTDIPSIPILKVDTINHVEIYIKREDLIDPEISGNKFWKLLYNIENYINQNPIQPLLITFGGAYSNHIAATAALGKKLNIPTIGLIRGDEIENKWSENPTLQKVHQDGMSFKFIKRDQYREKENLAKKYQQLYPSSLIIPEGGTNDLAMEGIKFMLGENTKTFDYLCSAVGTGGTLSGLSKFCEIDQKILGFKAVNDSSLNDKILKLSKRNNFTLFEASQGGYGKINDELISFINEFYQKYQIPLEPIYTGKMMQHLFKLIMEGYFPKGTKILAFHTGGLQGIKGINELLEKQQKKLINFQG